MAIKTYWLDGRSFVNGKNTSYDNRINLNNIVSEIVENDTYVTDTVDAAITAAATVNNNTQVVEESLDLTSADYRILTAQTGDAIAVGLPDPLTVPGKSFFIKTIGYTDPVVIAPAAGTIDGAASISLTSLYSFVEVFAYDDAYFISAIG